MGYMYQKATSLCNAICISHKHGGFQICGQVVEEDHLTKAPTTIMYAGVVSRETIRISLMITAFNDLEIKLADIFNLYKQALVTEQI